MGARQATFCELSHLDGHRNRYSSCDCSSAEAKPQPAVRECKVFIWVSGIDLVCVYYERRSMQDASPDRYHRNIVLAPKLSSTGNETGRSCNSAAICFATDRLPKPPQLPTRHLAWTSGVPQVTRLVLDTRLTESRDSTKVQAVYP